MKPRIGILLLLLAFGDNFLRAQMPVSSATLSIQNVVVRSMLGIDTNATFLTNQGFAQGWAFDGVNGYKFDTGDIYTYNSNWVVTAVNGNPFSGLTNYSHLGAGVYHAGNLYVAMETYAGCGSVTNQSIGVFNATNLSRISVTVVSNYQNEISAVTYDPDMGTNGSMIASSFCGGNQLFIYSLPTLAYVGTITMSQSINSIQGIGYYSGTILLIADNGGSGVVYAVDPNVGMVRLVTTLSATNSTEYEGIDCSQGNFRVAEAATGLYFFNFLNAGVVLTISGTNGMPGKIFYALAATNTSEPITNWTVIATNSFDTNGVVNVTTTSKFIAPQQFFRLEIP